MNKSDISVIVPVYNAEKALKRCIDSLISQSFENLEIVIVDDGSTDRSGNICDEYAASDSRIKVFHNKNHGVSYSRNFGITNSVGKYIMFCDSDDYVDENWCLEHYKAITAHPDSWVVSGVKNIYPDGTEIEALPVGCTESTVLDVSDYFKIFKSGVSGFPFNHIFVSEKLNGIRFDEKISCGEDVLFNNQYLKICSKIVCIEKCPYNYIRGQGTLSTKYNSNFFYIHKPLYESRKHFISEKDMPEFCRTYFYIFDTGLKMTFDRRNRQGFFKKLRFNNKILNDRTFAECIEKAELSGESQKYIALLKNKSYFPIYLLGKLSKIKSKVKDRGNKSENGKSQSA